MLNLLTYLSFAAFVVLVALFVRRQRHFNRRIDEFNAKVQAWSETADARLTKLETPKPTPVQQIAAKLKRR